MLEALVGAIGDCPIVIERRENVVDGFQDVVDAANVEEGFLLPGEGSVGQVFGRRRRADGVRHFA